MRLAILFLVCINAYCSDGVIKFIKGDVKINNKKAKTKQVFNFGDTFTTSKSSLAIISIDNKSILKLKQNTKLTIEKPIINDVTQNIFSLAKGEIFLNAKNTKKDKYQVKTRTAVFGVRGTEFFVSESGDKNNTWMCVNEGQVSVSIKGKTQEVLVNAGQGVVVNSNKLPKVKNYAWTKKLNWKMSGDYEELKDETDIQNINYDIQNFDYD